MIRYSIGNMKSLIHFDEYKNTNDVNYLIDEIGILDWIVDNNLQLVSGQNINKFGTYAIHNSSSEEQSISSSAFPEYEIVDFDGENSSMEFEFFAKIPENSYIKISLVTDVTVELVLTENPEYRIGYFIIRHNDIEENMNVRGGYSLPDFQKVYIKNDFSTNDNLFHHFVLRLIDATRKVLYMDGNLLFDNQMDDYFRYKVTNVILGLGPNATLDEFVLRSPSNTETPVIPLEAYSILTVPATTYVENGTLHLANSITFKGGTKMDMYKANPILQSREIAVEVDTGQMKIGNGTDRWNKLPYVSGVAQSSSIQASSFLIEGIVSTPPNTITIGNSYIIGEYPSGDFEDAIVNSIAKYDGDKWNYILPSLGLEVINISNGQLLRYIGDQWIHIATFNLGVS